MFINNFSTLGNQFYTNLQNSRFQSSAEKVSSGKKINKASDDVAGLAIASRLGSLLKSINTASSNTSMGVSMLQTAEAGQSSITDSLQRMRELAVAANNGTTSTADKQALQAEYNELASEIDRVANTTTFNGTNLTNANSTISLHVGSGATDTTTVSLQDVSASSLGVDTGDLVSNPSAAIAAIDNALDTVSSNRAQQGAAINSLSFTSQNLENTAVNVEAARSRIEDADFVKEVSSLIQSQILTQATLKMMSVSNKNLSTVVSLLQA